MWQPYSVPLYNLPRSICFAVAIAVHLGLLLVAGRWHTPLIETAELIRVSLESTSAAPSDPGANAASDAAAQMAVPIAPRPAAVEPRPAPVIQRPRVKPRIAKKTAPAASAQPVQAPVEAAGAAIAAGAGDLPGAASGTGSMAAAGGGTGGGGAIGGRGGGTSAGGDQRGYCLECPEPGYPMIARHRGWSGRVDVELVLLADGRVDRATVRRSSGYEVLDREALQVARRSRFRLPNPAAAPVHGHIEYRFELIQ